MNRFLNLAGVKEFRSSDRFKARPFNNSMAKWKWLFYNILYIQIKFKQIYYFLDIHVVSIIKFNEILMHLALSSFQLVWKSIYLDLFLLIFSCLKIIYSINIHTICIFTFPKLSVIIFINCLINIISQLFIHSYCYIIRRSDKKINIPELLFISQIF